MAKSIAPIFANAQTPSTENLAKALGQVAASGGGDTFDGRELLRMDKTGDWSYGQDVMEVEPEQDEFAINPFSFQHGYICWKDEAVVGERMVPVSEPLPVREELPQTGAAWDEQLRFDLQTVDDENPVELLYKVTSHGGKKAVRKLTQKIVSKIAANSPYIVPVITVGNDYYKHKKYGRIYTPVINVVAWLNLEGEPEEVDHNALEAPAEEEEPKKASKRSNGKRSSGKRSNGTRSAKKEEPKTEPEEEAEEAEPEEQPVATPRAGRRGRRRQSA